MPEIFDFCRKMSLTARERLDESPIIATGGMIRQCGAMSFASGEPADELYPVSELEEAFGAVFREPLGYYAFEAGLCELRSWIAEWMISGGVAPSWVSEQNVVITTGGMEAIALTAEALLDPGSVVVVEDPTYVEALMALRKTGAQIVGVRCDDGGIVTEELEDILSRHRVRFLYTIPNFQNPGGHTCPQERRRKVLEITGRHGVPIVEDDPYRYLSYDADAPASYMSLCGDERRVVYLGSFSKLIAPALRTGFIVAPDALMPPLVGLRTIAGITTPTVVQRGVNRLLRTIDLSGHIGRINALYRQRRDGMVRSMREVEVHSNAPEGGFFIWCRMNDGEDGRAFSEFAIKNHKIGVLPGESFSVSGCRNTFRISFSKVTPQMSLQGSQRLREALREYRSR